MRAYPSDEGSLATVVGELERFDARRFSRRVRERLVNSGLAGTAIRYRFFWPMAKWLAERWPERLRYDWDKGDFEDRLRAALPVVLPWLAAEAVKRSEEPLRAVLDRLRGTTTDAVFVLRGLDALPGGARTREAIHDAIDAAYVLDPGPEGPSRTRAFFPVAPIVFRSEPPQRARPDLRREIERPPLSVRFLAGRQARAAIDLAREAMVTRSRDLDAFSWGDPRDVRIVDDGGGLAFVFIGVVPDRRLPLAAVYGGITLRCAVPIGYVQVDALLGGAELSFNTFATFRGGEAAFVFSRLLAAVRAVFGAEAFSIEPYQLGHGNEEGLASGAWWFYYKRGFRPHDAAVKKVLAVELAAMRRDPEHRSNRRTLERLAARHLYWEPRRGRHVWLPLVPGLGLRIPPMSEDEAEEVAGARLGVRSTRGWTAAERLAWRRLAPVVAALPRVERWSSDERRSAVKALRAKGGRRESDFIRAVNAHPALRGALIELLVRRGAR